MERLARSFVCGKCTYQTNSSANYKGSHWNGLGETPSRFSISDLFWVKICSSLIINSILISTEIHYFHFRHLNQLLKITNQVLGILSASIFCNLLQLIPQLIYHCLLFSELLPQLVVLRHTLVSSTWSCPDFRELIVIMNLPHIIAALLQHLVCFVGSLPNGTISKWMSVFHNFFTRVVRHFSLTFKYC